MLEAIVSALESAERQRPSIGEEGLWFGLTAGDWYVQIAFDGFADLYNEKTGQRKNGRIPKTLMPRLAKLLPGLPPPSTSCPDDDDTPF